MKLIVHEERRQHREFVLAHRSMDLSVRLGTYAGPNAKTNTLGHSRIWNTEENLNFTNIDEPVS